MAHAFWTLKTGQAWITQTASAWASNSASYLGLQILLQKNHLGLQIAKEFVRLLCSAYPNKISKNLALTYLGQTRRPPKRDRTQHAEATHQPPVTHNARVNVSISRTFRYTLELQLEIFICADLLQFGDGDLELPELGSTNGSKFPTTRPFRRHQSVSRSHPTAEKRRNILEPVPGHTNL